MPLDTSDAPPSTLNGDMRNDMLQFLLSCLTMCAAARQRIMDLVAIVGNTCTGHFTCVGGLFSCYNLAHSGEGWIDDSRDLCISMIPTAGGMTPLGQRPLSDFFCCFLYQTRRHGTFGEDIMSSTTGNIASRTMCSYSSFFWSDRLTVISMLGSIPGHLQDQ